jgi:glycosyltransferase involved in cell wall biosynthesis
MGWDPLDAPRITIIVPALNEARWIAQSVESLRHQDYPAGLFEIVVVDNGSTDGTPDLVRAMDVKFLQESEKSAYRARNLAITRTTGDWLAFTDADCIADRDWLRQLWIAARDTGAGLVGGLTVYQPVRHNVGTYHLIYTHRPEVIREQVEVHHCVAGGNMFVQRKMFDELGLFSPLPSSSDIEFSKRVAAAGVRVVFAPEARVIHQCDLTNFESLKRAFFTNVGQAQHFASAGSWNFLDSWRDAPWRPGLNAPRPANDDFRHKHSITTWWAYCWLYRWFGYFGSVWANLSKRLFSKGIGSD